jgi:mRNA interferase MazF
MGKAIVCPITTTDKDYPFQVKLDGQTVTAGVVMCEQLKALDIRSRGFKFVEKAPRNILERCSALCRSMLAIE